MAIKADKLNFVQIFVLAISIIVTILAMLRAAGWQVDFGTLAFLVWAISPYIFVWSLGILLKKFTRLPKISLALCVTAILMFIFTVLSYIGTFADASSTDALVFVFAPIYLYVGSIVVLAVGLLTARLFGRRNVEIS